MSKSSQDLETRLLDPANEIMRIVSDPETGLHYVTGTEDPNEVTATLFAIGINVALSNGMTPGALAKWIGNIIKEHLNDPPPTDRPPLMC